METVKRVSIHVGIYHRFIMGAMHSWRHGMSWPQFTPSVMPSEQGSREKGPRIIVGCIVSELAEHRRETEPEQPEPFVGHGGGTKERPDADYGNGCNAAHVIVVTSHLYQEDYLSRAWMACSDVFLHFDLSSRRATGYIPAMSCPFYPSQHKKRHKRSTEQGSTRSSLAQTDSSSHRAPSRSNPTS